MKLFGFEVRRAGDSAERRDNIENPTVPVSADNFMRFFGVGSIDLGPITVEKALSSPPVFAAVNFLSRTLASLPLNAWRNTENGPVKITGGIATLVRDAPNPNWTSFAARQYFWQQVFTRGRGLSWIERGSNAQPLALWPINVARAGVMMQGTTRSYTLDGQTYSAGEVIELPFMLRDDQCGVVSPLGRCAQAVALSLEMEAYGRKFFSGGGVPPLALVGKLAAGPEALKRQMADVYRAIDAAKESDKPIFPMPPDYDLKPVGFDPAKGQMTEARRFQMEEIARIFQLPPVFLQDLTNGTFSNTEQQDLFFVKHLISQWAQALEQEMNLKLFGQKNAGRYVRHDLDGLMRGDFKSRIAGFAQAIQTAQLSPDEAREMEGRPPKPLGDKLYIQGATVPLGTQPLKPTPGEQNDRQA